MITLSFLLPEFGIKSGNNGSMEAWDHGIIAFKVSIMFATG
jgi:hypothetical protein